MEDIEAGGILENPFEHADVVSKGIDAASQAERLRATGDQFRSRLRVAAGEQGYLVALSDQFLGQVGHHPFSAALQLGGGALVKGGALSGPRANSSSGTVCTASW